jgi:hypothetical protein
MIRTTIKIMQRRPGGEFRAYCLRCHRFVRSQGRVSHETWRTKSSALKHATVHLEWHQHEDHTPLYKRWFWNQDWPVISEVSDGDEKEKAS